MKRLLTIILLGLGLSFMAAAQEEAAQEEAAQEEAEMRHQVRLGWGDMMFETVAFHPGLAANGNRTGHYGYTGHIFAGYNYSFKSWVAFGAEVDFEGIFWREAPSDQYRRPTGESVSVRNYDLTIMPEVKFTFYEKEWVKLYAGVGFGALIAFDNKKGVEGAPAFNLNLFGVWMGKGHWGGALELGMFNALTGTDKIYMLGSRLISVSVNYNW